MKKLVAMTLVLCFCFASSAFALTTIGTVTLKDDDSWLNLRKTASTSSTVIAYMQNGTVVTILDEANITNGFYRISGRSYTNHHDWSGKATRTGYASTSYIK